MKILLCYFIGCLTKYLWACITLLKFQAEVARSMTETVKLSDLFVTRGSRMALFLSCTMVGSQQLSGVNVILFYGQTIFEMAGSSVSSSLCQIIIGSILFVCGALAIPLTSYFGMKNLLIVSAVGTSVFQVGFLALHLIFLWHTSTLLFCQCIIPSTNLLLLYLLPMAVAILVQEYKTSHVVFSSPK